MATRGGSRSPSRVRDSRLPVGRRKRALTRRGRGLGVGGRPVAVGSGFAEWQGPLMASSAIGRVGKFFPANPRIGVAVVVPDPPATSRDAKLLLAVRKVRLVLHLVRYSAPGRCACPLVVCHCLMAGVGRESLCPASRPVALPPVPEEVHQQAARSARAARPLRQHLEDRVRL